MNQTSSQPDVEGDLQRYPLPRLLYYLFSKRFVGLIEVTRAQGGNATIYFRDGVPVHVAMMAMDTILGQIMLEQGWIDTDMFNRSLEALARSPEDHIDALRDMDISRERLIEGLNIQLRRQINKIFFDRAAPFVIRTTEHKFGTSRTARHVRADPLRVIYHGVRNSFDTERLEPELVKLRGATIQIHPQVASFVDRYNLDQEDEGLVQVLSRGAVQFDNVLGISNLSPVQTHMMIYTLWVTEALIVTNAQQHAVEPSHVGPAPEHPQPSEQAPLEAPATAVDNLVDQPDFDAPSYDETPPLEALATMADPTPTATQRTATRSGRIVAPDISALAEQFSEIATGKNSVAPSVPSVSPAEKPTITPPIRGRSGTISPPQQGATIPPPSASGPIAITPPPGETPERGARPTITPPTRSQRPTITPTAAATPAARPTITPGPTITPPAPGAAPTITPPGPTFAPPAAGAAPTITPPAPGAAPTITPPAPGPTITPPAPGAAPTITPPAAGAAPTITPLAPEAAPTITPPAPGPTITPPAPGPAPAITPPAPTGGASGPPIISPPPVAAAPITPPSNTGPAVIAPPAVGPSSGPPMITPATVGPTPEPNAGPPIVSGTGGPPMVSAAGNPPLIVPPGEAADENDFAKSPPTGVRRARLTTSSKPKSADEADKHRQRVVAAHKEMEDQNHFEVLGLERGASANEVREAYFRLAKQFHPDRVAGLGIDDVATEAEEIFRRINEANTVLTDPQAREDYEHELDGGPEAQSARSALQAEFCFQKGMVFFRKRNYVEALEMFKEAVKHNPDEGEHLAWVAWTVYNDPRTREKPGIKNKAKDQLLEAVKMSPKSAISHYFLGEIYLAVDDEKRAVTCFQRSIELNPRQIEAQRQLKIIERRREKSGKGKKSGFFKRFKKK